VLVTSWTVGSLEILVESMNSFNGEQSTIVYEKFEKETRVAAYVKIGFLFRRVLSNNQLITFHFEYVKDCMSFLGPRACARLKASVSRTPSW